MAISLTIQVACTYTAPCIHTTHNHGCVQHVHVCVDNHLHIDSIYITCYNWMQQILTLKSGWRAPYIWHYSPARPTAGAAQAAGTRFSQCACETGHGYACVLHVHVRLYIFSPHTVPCNPVHVVHNTVQCKRMSINTHVQCYTIKIKIRKKVEF